MQIDGYNFTERMQATFWGAVGEAQSLGQEYIGTEHLLLALLAGRVGCGAAALRSLGVDLQAAENRVLAILQRSRGLRSASSGALLPVTSRGKKVLELAKEEARSLDHPLIGTEHLLLGMLVEGKGVAAQVLHESGVDLEKARSRVLTIRETIADDDHYAVPADEQPALVRVVLEYVNGAVLSKQFTTAREAAAFLEEQGRV